MYERYRRWTAAILTVTDVLFINLAFGVAYWLRYELQWFAAVDQAYRVPIRSFIPISLAMTALLLAIYRFSSVYNLARGASWLDEVYRVVAGTATGMVLMIFVIVFFFRPLLYSRLVFVYSGLLITILLGLSRLVKRGILRQMHRKGRGVDRLLIVGAGEVGRTVMRNIVAQPMLGYRIVGFVDDDPDKSNTDIGRFPALGTTANIPRLVQEIKVDEVIVTLPWMYHRKIVSIVAQCERHQVKVRIVPDVFQMTLSHLDTEDLGGIPMIGVREIAISRGERVVKRAMDLLISLTSLILLMPLLLIVALLIKLDSRGPVLYRQTRMGKGEHLFTLYKFRSMRQGAEAEQAQLMEHNEATGPLFKMKNDPRVTRVGRHLRRTSIDELPQFLNVLLGHMSVVGPRPAPPSEVERYQAWHKRRLDVSPGITGLWQVSGRSQLTFDEMVLLDLYYIENWSPLLDLQIILRTVPQFFIGEGAY